MATRKLVIGPDCDVAQRLDDRRYGYPTPGVPVGRGKHYPLQKSPGPGWSIHNQAITTDEKTGERTYPVTAPLEEDIAKANAKAASDPSKLTDEERDLVSLTVEDREI